MNRIIGLKKVFFLKALLQLGLTSEFLKISMILFCEVPPDKYFKAYFYNQS